jgi:hypothetical protein
MEVGPVTFRVGSAWGGRCGRCGGLYAGLSGAGRGRDYTVRLEPAEAGRRWVRPSVRIGGDYVLPDAAPLPLAHGLVAAEMAMNLQMALGERRFLLLHAASVEKDGRGDDPDRRERAGQIDAFGDAGRARLALHGRRVRAAGARHRAAPPVPPARQPEERGDRVVEALVGAERFGPAMEGTPKGGSGICGRLRRQSHAWRGGAPALILFPRYGKAGTCGRWARRRRSCD